MKSAALLWLIFPADKVGDGDDSRLNIPIASSIGSSEHNS